MAYDLLDQGGHVITDARRISEFSFMLDTHLGALTDTAIEEALKRKGYEIRQHKEISR